MFKVNRWLLQLRNSVAATGICAFTRATVSLAFLQQQNHSDSVACVNGLVVITVWFHESGFVLLFVLTVCFGFYKRYLFDLSGFDPDSGFSFKTDSQKNENCLKWILWIRISEIVLMNTSLFSFRFETES